jgi:ABC-type multidrug transport system fused ATPase/permease subunit
VKRFVDLWESIMNKKNKINSINIKNEARSSRFVVDLKAQAEQKEEQKNVLNKKEKVSSFFEKIIEIEFKKSFLNFKNKASSSLKKSIKNVGDNKVLNKNNENKEGEIPGMDGNFSKKKKLLGLLSFKKNTGEEGYARVEENGEIAKSLFKKAEVGKESLLEEKEEKKENLFSNFKRLKNSESFKKLENLAFLSIFFLGIKIIFKTFYFIFKISYKIGWVSVFIFNFIFIVFKRTNNFFSKAILKVFKKISSKFQKNTFFIKNKIFRTKDDAKHKAFSIVNTFKKKIDAKREKIKKIEEENEKDYYFEEENKTLKQKLKPVVIFGFLLLILILPFKAYTFYKSMDVNGVKGKVLGATEEAFSEFMDAAGGASSMDFNKAQENFSKAGDGFVKAQEHLEEINGLLFTIASVIPKEEIKMASMSKDILKIGESASLLGTHLSKAFAGIFESKEDSLIEIIDNFSVNSNLAVLEAKKINEIIAEININNLPSKYRDNLEDLKAKSLDLENGLSAFNEITEGLKIFLGTNKDKRYLFVFQNNTELRASGGFIGSYALIDFREGKIRNMEVPSGGGYDTEAGLRELVASPEPLHLVDPLWHFWDANWWPDWQKSAKKLMWFYERSDGPTVDGVISLTPTVIEGLLEAIGPIDMSEDYGVIIDSENFWITTQAIAEEKLTKEQIDNGEKHEPKKIIGDMLNKLFEELPKRLNRESLVKIMASIENDLSGKHILFYFNDPELQKKAEDYGWAGRIKETKYDYLSIINTNIAGGKSDRKMEEEIKLDVNIENDGTVINTLKIKRKHTGIKREPFSGVRNVNWMRIYVPLGSELLEAGGFRTPSEIYFEDPDISWGKDKDVYEEELNSKTDEESGVKIYSESNKTVFANWSMVDPGEEVIVYIKYKLPFKVKQEEKEENFLSGFKTFLNPAQKPLTPYSILFQKQPGAMPSELEVNAHIPYNYEAVWKYPEQSEIKDRTVNYESYLDNDKYFVLFFENSSI